MNAKTVDELFNEAWAGWATLEKEVKLFVQENDINPDFFKVEMSGPHVKIKHRLPDVLWTEELHDLFCETFGVHLQYFERTFSKTQKVKPALGGFYWVYGDTQYGEKFIVPYNELGELI